MSDTKPLITYQAAPDESYLIGTVAQLLSFAQKIIEAVKQAKPDDIFDEDILSANLVHGALDGKGSVKLD